MKIKILVFFLIIIYPLLKTIQGIGGVYIILRNKGKILAREAAQKTNRKGEI